MTKAEASQPSRRAKPCRYSAARILLVDDQPEILVFIEATLRMSGYQHLSSVRDGQTALLRAYEERPDLIVMDVMIPRGNGLHVLRLLKARPSTADIPVIITTGFDLENLESTALASVTLLK